MNGRTADYAISGVRYNADRSRLLKLRVHRVRAGNVDAAMEATRAPLIAALAYGRTFTTARLDEAGPSLADTPVRLIHVQGQAFLRCDDQDLPADYLPHVAEF